jgi:2-oxoglutarate ferredoxin oxidoreductase subunit beta
MSAAADLTTADSPTVNLVGLEKSDYKGRKSTLCQGCGHNSISSQITAACFEMSLPPERIIKLSGIGCSSKSPAYFMSRSHAFNSLHGRMAPIATGAMIANRSLEALGVSGDGDTASIGLGQFKHLVRRNVPIVYIVENNGVYGLTKGQFSATADKGQVIKSQRENPFLPVDICMEALVANCGFVARSFAGDPKQVKELIKAALAYDGTAVVDIISPCVTFNNRDESTKSYTWGREHEDPLHDVTLVPVRKEITVDYRRGERTSVEMHDGSRLVLEKLSRDYDPTNRAAAVSLLEEAEAKKLLLTGLIYYNDQAPTLHEVEHLVETPLATLPNEVLRPASETLEALMAEHR